MDRYLGLFGAMFMLAAAHVLLWAIYPQPVKRALYELGRIGSVIHFFLSAGLIFGIALLCSWVWG